MSEFLSLLKILWATIFTLLKLGEFVELYEEDLPLCCDLVLLFLHLGLYVMAFYDLLGTHRSYRPASKQYLRWLQKLHSKPERSPFRPPRDVIGGGPQLLNPSLRQVSSFVNVFSKKTKRGWNTMCKTVCKTVRSMWGSVRQSACSFASKKTKRGWDIVCKTVSKTARCVWGSVWQSVCCWRITSALLSGCERLHEFSVLHYKSVCACRITRALLSGCERLHGFSVLHYKSVWKPAAAIVVCCTRYYNYATHIILDFFHPVVWKLLFSIIDDFSSLPVAQPLWLMWGVLALCDFPSPAVVWQLVSTPIEDLVCHFHRGRWFMCEHCFIPLFLAIVSFPCTPRSLLCWAYRTLQNHLSSSLPAYYLFLQLAHIWSSLLLLPAVPRYILRVLPRFTVPTPRSALYFLCYASSMFMLHAGRQYYNLCCRTVFIGCRSDVQDDPLLYRLWGAVTCVLYFPMNLLHHRHTHVMVDTVSRGCTATKRWYLSRLLSVSLTGNASPVDLLCVAVSTLVIADMRTYFHRRCRYAHSKSRDAVLSFVLHRGWTSLYSLLYAVLCQLPTIISVATRYDVWLAGFVFSQLSGSNVQLTVPQPPLSLHFLMSHPACWSEGLGCTVLPPPLSPLLAEMVLEADNELACGVCGMPWDALSLVVRTHCCDSCHHVFDRQVAIHSTVPVIPALSTVRPFFPWATNRYYPFVPILLNDPDVQRGYGSKEEDTVAYTLARRLLSQRTVKLAVSRSKRAKVLPVMFSGLQSHPVSCTGESCPSASKSTGQQYGR
jgi:hypothetical protein